MDENQKPNENLNEKEKAKEAILSESKMSEDKKKAKAIKTKCKKCKTQAKANKDKGKKQDKVLKQKLLVGASVLATAIVLVIALVGSYNQIQPQRMGEIARSMTYGKVNTGDEKVSETGGNVEFDAFFLRDLNNDGVAEGIRGTSRTVGEEDTLYMELNVLTNGRLENGVITIEGDNFYLKAAIPRDGEIQENAIGNNIKEIKLNTIKNGTQKLLTGIVCSGDYSKPSAKTSAIGKDTSKYTGKGKVTLKGTYITDEESEGMPFTKEVEFNVDWHGTVKAEMPSYLLGNNLNREQDISTAIDEEKGTFTVKHIVGMQEINNQLNIKKAYIETEIPQLSGYDPDTVRVTGNNVKFDYNPTTRKLTAESNAKLDESNVITTQAYDGTYASGNNNFRYNKFNIEIVYPLKAYQEVGSDTIEHQMTVKGYYEGYNNEHSEFPHPYKSNEVKATFVLRIKNPSGTVANFDVIVGKYVYEPSGRYIVSKEKPLRIYNGLSEKEDNDIYTVRWYGYTGSDGADKIMVMKERKDNAELVSDEFLKTGGQYDSMENLTSNIGIYFSNASSILGEDGEIKVFDDELNELLMTFNKGNWSTYSESNPYRYERPVKHIRIETSKTNANSSLYVYNIKKLDDEYITTHYAQEKFDELQEIKSTLNGYLGNTHINQDIHSAKYEAPYTIASIAISKDTLSTQETEKNFKITLKAEANTAYNQVKWQNGAFLVKLPKDIVDVEINEVKSTNSVRIVSSEQYKEGENCYIKINTENDTPTTFDVIIDCDITPDPRIKTQTETVELQYSNANAVVYWNEVQDTNDVNGNLNTSENIGKATKSLSLVSPSSLLTSETITEYDSKNSITIAPQIASVEKTQNSAKINIQLTNNYSSTISEVKILGRVPYTENRYVINGGTLGSTFNTTMQGKLTLPQELQDIAKVYYSDNIDATEDVELQSNNWKQDITDFTNIKSYLIDLGTKKIDKDAEYEISYEVTIPTNLNYNQVSYSHHAVYFSLDTTEGKYPTQTEPNKVGLMIAKQYDLELIKYQKGKSNIVPGATYFIKEEGAEEGKTRVTDIYGTLTVKDLYVDRIYVIKEIKSPTSYELNETEVKFKVTEEGGVLKLVDDQTVKGNAKSIQIMQPQDGQGYKVQVQVEDEVKASLKIVKMAKETGTPLNGVRFKITGKNYEDGRSITTNTSGEATLIGLSIGQKYTLEEIKADGYYLASKITFTINNNSGSYTVEKAEENGQTLVKDAQVQEAENIPTLTLNIDNEKIPEYTLKINKVVKGEDKPLEGAKFRLFKETEKIRDYTTDGQGSITIQNLYQYEALREIDQTYTLKELLAPNGYAQVKDITFYVTKNEEGSLTMEIKEGKIKGYDVDNDNNIVTVTIEDSPSFKLIKKDGETDAPLPGTKFAIYNVDTGIEQLALDSKYNILGEKEVINGKTYYTLTTNDKGEIEANLREGLYKAVEIKTEDEKYDITNNVYYFGIGASREALETMAPTFATSFGESDDDRINTVSATNDGGYIVGGSFTSSITVGDYKLKGKGYDDGLLIKYKPNEDLESQDKYIVEWATSFGGSEYDGISSVAQTSDGGYIVGGYWEGLKGHTIMIGDHILTSSTTGYNYSSDGLLVKYKPNEETSGQDKYIVEWATSFGGGSDDEITSVSETSDGGYIVGGYFNSSSITVGNYTLNNNGSNDGLLIKCDEYGNAEWATSIGESGEDKINSVAQTSDGGYIVGGYFNSSSITVGTYTLKTNGNYDGLLIKYKPNEYIDSEDKYIVEWATSIGESGEDEINSVAQTSDGGYIVGGYFSSTSITVGNYTLNNNGSNDGLLIKCDGYGNAEWATSFGEYYKDEVTSISVTSDGGYIVGGYFGSNSITIGDYTLNNSRGGWADGLLIKYSANGDIKGATSFGGSSNDYVISATQTSDGGYIVGGYFGSNSITIGDYTLNNSRGVWANGLLIKYEPKELANPVTITATSIGKNSSDQINTVVKTSDGGYIVGGVNAVGLRKYKSTNELEWYVSSLSVTSVAETNDQGYIVGDSNSHSVRKYNSLGELEWNKSISATINSVSATSDGGYIVGGYFSNSSITVGDYTLTNNGSYDGLLIKYSKDGEVERATSFGESDDDRINTVSATNDGGYIVGGYWSGRQGDTITIGGYELKSNTDSNPYNELKDGLLIKYGAEGEIEWATSFGGSYSDQVNSVAQTSDGGYIVGGHFKGSSITVGDYVLKNNGHTNYFEGLVIKYKENGEVEWATSFGEYYKDEVTSISVTSDGGYIVGGYFETNSIIVEDYALNSKGSSDGLLIKYKPNTNLNNPAKYVVDWVKSVGGIGNDKINSAVELQDGTILAGGYFASQAIEIDGKTLTNNSSSTSYSDGMLLKVANMIGVPEVEELEVKNYVKEFKITTDVEEINGEKGGSISGEDLPAYEIVKYNNNSTAEIKMTPKDDTYEIIKVTINGVEQNFTPSEDGSYTLDKFQNMKENKHIVVTYAKKANKVVIKKVDSKTESPLEGVEFKIEQVNENGADESTLYNATVKTNKEGKVVIELKYGQYRITEVKVPDGYAKLENPIVIEFKESSKRVVDGTSNARYNDSEGEYIISNTPLSKVTVHHYLKKEDGSTTTDRVADDDHLTGKLGDTYQTKPHLDLQKYELEKDGSGAYITPDEASGEYREDEIVVIYYYTLKKIPLTVHHYIQGTETPVPLASGEDAKDETDLGTENQSYKTSAKTPEELNPKYEFKEVAGNAEGTYQYDEVIVTYYYAVKDSPGVLVHHKEKGTGKTLSADVTLPEDRHTPKYGDSYQTKPATDIPVNYKLVETPSNASGTMIDELTEVTYEYVLKDPQITNESIEKTGTESIETKDAEVSYTVNYNVTVSEYIGQAQITIVDTLPHPIDLSKSNLDNGEYNAENHTITWQEVIDINTYENGVAIDGSEEKGITLNYTKNIKVVFSSMDYSAKEMKNNVSGNIKLYTPEKEGKTVTDDATTKTNFTKELTAIKVWDHKNSIYEKPTQVKLQVIKTVNGEDKVEQEKVVTLSENTVEGNENKWSYTFTDLPKYDEKGNEIEYKVEEAEVEEGELLYYNASIDQEEKTITNTYIGPVISSKKESAGKNGKDYVIEAETITYTITVTNEGGVGKDVVIKDTVPVGTTFVKGSIKVNGEDSYKLGEDTIQLADMTEQNLESGITVNVPKKENGTQNEDGSMQEGKNGQVTLSFDVTVNDLPEGKYLGEITNTATVDDIPTEEVTDTVKKPNISFEKKAEVERGVASWETKETIQNPDSEKKVKENDTITYKIVLTNSGEAEGTAIVKDTIPAGTEFVAGSIKVAENSEEDNQELSEKTADDLANEGISVVVGKGETKTLEFKVTVNNLEDQQMIKNKATVNNNSEKPENPEKETNVVEHKYVEPIISENKTHTTDESLSYVLEEEGVTFTIVAENAGGLAKDVVIKDEIPEGTSFIPGSIKVNGVSKYTYRGEEIDLSTKTVKDLNEGITVTVPAKGEGEVGSEDNGQIEKANGQTNLSFKVKIDELPENIFTKQITNTAKVDEKDTNEDKVLVNKTNVTYEKTSDPETGSKVAQGDIITYRIEAQNTGTAPADIEIYDSIPEGTSYVEGSLSVKQGLIATVRRYIIDDLTKTGIDLKLKDGEKVVVEFKVKVNENLKNGTEIKNVAEIDKEPTNETKHIVEAPNLSIEKKQEIVSGENYVVKGDEIEYSIILRNDGALGAKAIIKDKVPEGTSFVEGSMRINEGNTYTLPRELERGEIKGDPEELDEIDVSTMTEKNLEEGIEVYIGKQTGLLPETLTLSFKVKVNEDAQGEIRNTAQVQEEREPQETTDPSLPPVYPTVSPSSPVDPDNPENPDKNLKDPITSNKVKCPVITFEKQVEIHRTTEEDQPNIEAGKVTANDELTYKVIVRNTGKDTAKKVEVKDTIPDGTTIKEVSDDGQVKSNKEITWEIEEIPAGKDKTVSFTVTVGYSQQDRQIRNTAYVKGVETNETVTEYKKPEVKLETTVEKTGNDKITSTDTPVYYELTYTATIDCFVGKAKIKIVDELPYEIDEGASKLDEGKYDKDSKTITWEEEVENIDTYLTKEAQVITRHKKLSLKYIYEDEENLHGDIENKVKTTTELKEPNPDNPSEDKVVKKDEQEDNHIVVAEIPTTLTVHHYFYDKELKQETTTPLAPDEEREGLVGDSYTTSKSSKVPANYECMNENPEKKEGTLTKTPIEVTYYYTLKDETAKVEVTKEATADKEVEKEEYVIDQEERIETNEDGSMKTRKVMVPVITNEDGSITYKITYKVRIENYIGKAKIEIVDRLPAGINEKASDLQKGSYNSSDNTITWEEEIEDIDTFAKGPYEKTIEKEITVVYEGQNKASVLENTVEGKVTTYYPDIHPNKPGEEKQEVTDEDEEIVEQDYRTDVTVEKRWDDNENVKHHRPASVKVYLTANGQKVNTSSTNELEESLTNEVSENFAQVILSEENSWKHTFKNLPKYDNAGNLIEYSVEESEVNANDLEYYEDANISIVSKEKTLVKVIVTNSYRLVNTEIESSIEKNGTESITSSKQEVNYHIEYHATVKDYIGESTLTVTDTLPYRIDKENSDLKGGKYDDDLQTITWTEDLGHINTVDHGERKVDFEKDIKVVFKDLDATQYEMTNHVKGRIEFTENDTKNEVEDSHTTNIDVQGKVVVKYVDILTGKEITRVVKPGEEGNEEGQEDKEVTYGYEIEQKVGTDYTTEQKTIPTYDYVKNSGNTEGKIIEGTIEVTYYYIRSMSGGLTVKYVDEEGNDLLPEVKKEGRIDDPYTTEKEEIENYEFTEVTGDEPEGRLGVEPKEVVYHYRKIPAKVVVRYLEKETEEVLLPEKTIEGYVGDQYETTREAIENYRSAEPEPENSQGKMEKNDQDNTIYVTYYYEKIPSGKITAKYVDMDTGEEITYEEQGEDGNSERKTYREEMQGYVGERYVTEAKEIPYYKYLEDLKPTNGEGNYTEDDDTVMYYYRKLEFNISVEKNIVGARINGEPMSIKNNKLIKMEVVASKALTTKVEIEYEVIVKNTGELKGKAKVEENIPEGLKVSSKNPEYWKQANGKLTKEVELEAGGEEKLGVVLEWKNGNSNFGNMNNIVKVVSTENPANYLETTEEDNTSEAEAIISVKTGASEKLLTVILGTIASCGALVLLYEYETYQRERGVAIRHVVLDGQNVVIVKKKQGKKA